MTETYLDIQAGQRRRTLILLFVVFAVYFAAFLVPVSLARQFSAVAHRTQPPTLFDERSVATALFVGLALVLVQLWFARTHAVRMVLDALEAHAPDPADRYHRRLRNIVDEMSVAAGLSGRVRAVISPSMALSAFAAQDARSGAIVGVTEGLLSRLNRAETQAVVAHEVSHIRNGDARLTAITCALLAPFAFVANLAARISESAADEESPSPYALGAGGIAGLLSGLVLVLMRLICTTISRERELQADAGAVELTRNPLALARALHRVARRHHFMGSQTAAFSPIFVVDPTTSALSEREGWLSSLFSSHPPVAMRLKTLLEMAHAGPESLDESRSPAHVLEDMEALRAGRAGHEESEASQASPSSETEISESAVPAADTPPPPPRWHIAEGDAWSAPLTFDELAREESFGPNAWVMPLGGNSPTLVRADSLLLAAMRREPSKWMKNAPAEIANLARPPTDAAPVGACPHCLVPLHRQEYEGVPVESCTLCGGLFVKEIYARRILIRRETAFAPEFRRKVLDWAADWNIRREVDLSGGSLPSFGELHCPACGQALARRFFNYQYAIVVDRCFLCRSVWFDREELEILQVLVEATEGN